MQLSIKNKMLHLGLLLASLCSFSGVQLYGQHAELTKQTNEKIFVHTDKNDYLAGEILWFRPYLITEMSDSSHHYDHIVYTELLNDKGNHVLQSKTSLKDLAASGSFYLPTDLSSGNYTLVAYTSDMKNADARSFFRKRIVITNTLIEPQHKAGEKPAVLAHFFPEGGTLVQNISSKLGVQVLDPFTMKGLETRGAVLEDGKDTIARFTTSNLGLGQFTFTPATGKKYTAVLSTPGKTSVSIPNAQPSGYTLSLSENNNTYTVKIQAAGKTAEKLYLVAHDGQVNKLVKNLPAEAAGSVTDIEKTVLGRGVIYFTLFNAQLQPLCERLVFIPFNPEKKDLTIGTAKPVYQNREKASLTVNSTNISGAVDASLSVFKENDDDKQEPMWLYFSLKRHLRGEVQSPEFYFTKEATQYNYIDNLMLTHGWRQFKSQTAKTTAPSLTEFDGHVITAAVKDNWSKNAAPNIPCLLSVPSVPYGLYFGTSDSTGTVRFNVNGYYGPGDIFITAIPLSINTKPNYTIEVLTPFADSTTKTYITQPALYLKEADSTMLLKRSIAMQVSHIYSKEQLNRFLPPVVTDTLPFYGKAEYKYNLDDYKRFSTMEEVLREYVTPINVLARGGQLHMSIYDEKYQTIYNEGLLVLLDGVPLFDYNKIFAYNPYKVKKLEVVPRRYIFNSIAFSGIASFETYNSKFDGFELDPNAVAIDYEGLQIQREFYTPDYSQNKGNIRVPDNRATLLWKPVVSLQQGQQGVIDCFTSDLPGKYKIVIQGISKNGIPYYGENSFEVK